jgi:hypothetical protein
MSNRIGLHVPFTIDTDRTQRTELLQGDEGIEPVELGDSTS